SRSRGSCVIRPGCCVRVSGRRPWAELPLPARIEGPMRVKVCPVCPGCRAPHDKEVDPGTMVTCPDCDEYYRAEAPEPSDPVARPGDRSAAANPARASSPPAAQNPARDDDQPAAQKKGRVMKSDRLGKLIERFAPSQNRAALLSLAIGGGVLGAIVSIVALV